MFPFCTCNLPPSFPSHLSDTFSSSCTSESRSGSGTVVLFALRPFCWTVRPPWSWSVCPTWSHSWRFHEDKGSIRSTRPMKPGDSPLKAKRWTHQLSKCQREKHISANETLNFAFHMCLINISHRDMAHVSRIWADFSQSRGWWRCESSQADERRSKLLYEWEFQTTNLRFLNETFWHLNWKKKDFFNKTFEHFPGWVWSNITGYFYRGVATLFIRVFGDQNVYFKPEHVVF